MVTLVKLLQPENAEPPIDVTEEGMVTLVKFLQSENATFPIDVTEEGMEYVFAFFPDGYIITVRIVLSNRTSLMLA
jgi:hypothetical protein